MVASRVELARPESSKLSTPVILAKWPFTLAIIMCLTLNSAMAWAGSMFQVVMEVEAVCGRTAVVVIFLSFLSSFWWLRCVSTIVVATNI